MTTVKGNFSAQSAFNLDLALAESRTWIEAVVQIKFPSDDFQASLKNGVFLCKLINQIKPGIVPTINQSAGEFAQRENLSFFIKAAKTLGLRDTQLFESADLFDAKRIRNVAISLYWLGRAARCVPTYKGPQLNLLPFKNMSCSACKKAITDNNYLATLTQQWHTACATCCSCSSHLDPKQPFYMEGNNIWCPNCMVGATKIGSSPSGTGAAGQKPKTGTHHNHDNECTGCHGSLEKGYVPDDVDPSKKYCTTCICDLCHSPLIGNFNVIKNKKQPAASTAQPSNAGHGHNHSPQKSTTTTTSTTSNASKPTNSTGNGCKENRLRRELMEIHCVVHVLHLLVLARVVNARNRSLALASRLVIVHDCARQVAANDGGKSGGNGGSPFITSGWKPTDRCDGCAKSLDGQVAQVGGLYWHKGCFKCNGCSTSLQTGYYPRNGKPHCKPCNDKAEEMVSDKCPGCNRGIVEGAIVKSSGKSWHKACFKCATCQKALDNGSLAQTKFGKPYCQGCWAKEKAVCHKCRNQIQGEVVESGDKMYCKSHAPAPTIGVVYGERTAGFTYV
eukprot:gene19418-23252_t